MSRWWLRRASDRITGGQLFKWFNGLLGTNYFDFEEFSAGDVYCRLLEMLSPGSLPMEQVKHGARLFYDQRHKFLLLQQGLAKAGLYKEVPIDGLMAGEFNDHYEMAKWFKLRFDEMRPDVATRPAVSAAKTLNLQVRGQDGTE